MPKKPKKRCNTIDTPIYDFVKKYSESNIARLHMPGHKGVGPLGVEALDITEISGADSLYEANGIIEKSEQNATKLFKSGKTVYSAEGSSLCIRTMLYLALSKHLRDGQKGRTVIAGRNAHKSFLYSVAMLDMDVVWIDAKDKTSVCSCEITPEMVKKAVLLCEEKPAAVYITTPDYLGNVADVKAISSVCKELGVLLLVDNAHGAYLAFDKENTHPISLGADMCCDSGHKTLPVLTGGAYLHVSKSADKYLSENVKNAMAIFGSTSPSYLILQSLDLANKYLAEHFGADLQRAIQKTNEIKEKLKQKGFCLIGDEPLKITVFASKMGYTGEEIANRLRKEKIEVEHSDRDFVILMTGMALSDLDYQRLLTTLLGLEIKKSITKELKFALPKKAISIRQATMSPFETVAVKESLNRIVALPNAPCPPAVPVVVSGEVIDKESIDLLSYYNIEEICVVKD